MRFCLLADGLEGGELLRGVQEVPGVGEVHRAHQDRHPDQGLPAAVHLPDLRVLEKGEAGVCRPLLLFFPFVCVWTDLLSVSSLFSPLCLCSLLSVFPPCPCPPCLCSPCLCSPLSVFPPCLCSPCLCSPLSVFPPCLCSPCLCSPLSVSPLVLCSLLSNRYHIREKIQHPRQELNPHPPDTDDTLAWPRIGIFV